MIDELIRLNDDTIAMIEAMISIITDTYKVESLSNIMTRMKAIDMLLDKYNIILNIEYILKHQIGFTLLSNSDNVSNF